MEDRFEQLETDVYNHIHQYVHTSEELLKFLQFISVRCLEFRSFQNDISDSVKNCVNDLAILKQSCSAFQIQSLSLMTKLNILEEQLDDISGPLSSVCSSKNLVLAVAESIGAVCTRIKVSPRVDCVISQF